MTQTEISDARSTADTGTVRGRKILELEGIVQQLAQENDQLVSNVSLVNWQHGPNSQCPQTKLLLLNFI